MTAHRAAATVSRDGTVLVRGVPFAEGAAVDVIVLPRASVAPDAHAPLRGSVRVYEHPFEPTTRDGDWDAA